METSRRVATWLELAVAPEWRLKRSPVRVHAVGGRENRCFAISMDDRWLCATNGAVTVFDGLGAALHFLRLLRVEDFEPGVSPDQCPSGELERYSLTAAGKLELLPCSACQFGSCRDVAQPR